MNLVHLIFLMSFFATRKTIWPSLQSFSKCCLFYHVANFIVLVVLKGRWKIFVGKGWAMCATEHHFWWVLDYLVHRFFNTGKYMPQIGAFDRVSGRSYGKILFNFAAIKGKSVFNVKDAFLPFFQSKCLILGYNSPFLTKQFLAISFLNQKTFPSYKM